MITCPDVLWIRARIAATYLGFSVLPVRTGDAENQKKLLRNSISYCCEVGKQETYTRF